MVVMSFLESALAFSQTKKRAAEAAPVLDEEMLVIPLGSRKG
jgi:hypothetical protein